MIEVRIADDLWSSTMLPEGILERWLVANHARVEAGKPIVQLRIEDALHDLLAPGAGELLQHAPEGAIVDPGALIAEIR